MSIVSYDPRTADGTEGEPRKCLNSEVVWAPDFEGILQHILS